MKNSYLPLIVIVLLIYCACSPQLTIKGDGDNPIPINAEINIHIYQHASSVVDDLQDGLEEEYEEELEEVGGASDTSVLSKFFIHVVQNLGVQSAYAENNQQAEWERTKVVLKKSYRKAYPYLKAGYLGENRSGYVDVINKQNINEKATKKLDASKAAQIAATLNKARKAFYIIDSKMQKVNLATIQSNYAKAFSASAQGKGIWVETQINKNWKWIQK